MQDAKEEVRARLSVEDVIGEYVQLKRSGRNFKGLSPFTDERTPSFMVSPEKQIWHDFSSGQGGDIFSFIMLVEGMDFRQSLEHLARKAGVDISSFDGGSGQLAKRRDRARRALELAVRFYQQVLLRTPVALDYLNKKRHLNKQTIQEFQIGFAPDDGSALVKALEKRGFTKKELNDAGLINRFGGDLFRGRMVVLLSDSSGSPVGFTGRIIHDDPKSPKYLNTPQTILFDKSRHIFGLFQAKEAIRRTNLAVIVEGNLDVVSSHQAGVKNVVATAGTAMTEQHLKILSRLASRIRLAYDSDKAGLSATERAIVLAQKIGIDIEVISLPKSAKDPDELIQQDPELWRKATEQAMPAVEWVISQYQKREDLTTAEGKRRFTSASLSMVRSLSDAVEREHYLQQICQISGVSMEALLTKLRNSTDQAAVTQKLRQSKATKVLANQEGDQWQDAMMGIAMMEPATRRWLEAIEPEAIEGDEAQQLFEYLLVNRQQPVVDIPKNLQKIDQYVKIVQLKSDTRYAGWDETQLQTEMARVVKLIITKHTERKKQQLIDLLRDAETMGDEQEAATLRQAINALIKERA